MEIVILLVPLGLILAGIAVAAFMWGLRRGQFDDLDTRGWGVVFDDQARNERDPGSAGEDKNEEGASPHRKTHDGSRQS